MQNYPLGTGMLNEHATGYSKSTAPINDKAFLTNLLGCPVSNNKNSLTAGPTGPVLMQDVFLMEKISQFAREKIPSRVVHSLGCGAAGHFTVTKDITHLTRAKVFSQLGKKTPVVVRMSGTFTEQGEADTVRDLRGFACKFKTEEGNWDLMTINTPVFNCRDMKEGPDAVHACKRDPRSGLWNGNQIFDFVNSHPEGLHQLLMLWTDRSGTPNSFRKIHGWGCNTYSFLNAENKRVWIKFHLISQQGTGGFTVEEAKMVAGEDPNFLQRDLKEAIEKGMFPRWKLCIQVMPEEEGYQNPSAFDCTKVWPHGQYPLHEVGILELNKNPVDHFTEVEQVAFSPANVVPGISFSPDKLLQGRLIIYDDTQHHRIGPNLKEIPINAPMCPTSSNYYNGGNMQLQTRTKFPHYNGSMYGPRIKSFGQPDPPLRCDGPADYYPPPQEGSDFDYYAQPRTFWKDVLSTENKKNLCFNLAASLVKCDKEITESFLLHLGKVDALLRDTVKADLGARLSGAHHMTPAEKVVQMASQILQGATSLP